MLIDINTMRNLKVDNAEVRYKLIKQNIERFFRDYIYYYNIYDGKELIIDSGYLPYHYLDNNVLLKIITLLEVELGYSVIIVKTTNVLEKGYQKGDLINIRLFDMNETSIKDLDDYFNLRMYQAIYSTSHNYNNILGEMEGFNYLSCESNLNLLQEANNNDIKENNDNYNN